VATFLAELLVALLILVGAGFTLVGSYGLARLPTLMQRLHAPTKAATLGVGGLLLASMLHAALLAGAPSARELLVTLFLFLTAPVTAHMLAKAHIHRERRGETLRLPVTGRPVGWATLDGGDDVPPSGDRLAATRRADGRA
jgi:multicomponent K+:H+ antiporter subunit G